jgi:hypothetical protein
MFKYLKFYFFIVFLILNNHSHAVSEVSDLKLSNNSINEFFNYISSPRKNADRFLVTLDGTGTFTWSCPQTLCFPAGELFYAKPCSEKYEKKKCKIFASGRKIVWSNSTNMSQNSINIKQSISLTDVKNKLKKLGFID